jgi:hypothetical protein
LSIPQAYFDDNVELIHSLHPTKFRFILAKQFQRRRFLEIGQPKTRIACGAMFVICRPSVVICL